MPGLRRPKTPRKKSAEQAITALGDYDTDTSSVQPRVRNMIAKLQMAAGLFDEARKSFQSVSDEKTTLVPPPNPFEQYEARYFTVVSDVLALKLAEAQADKAALDAWQASVLPKLLAGANLDAAAIAANKKELSQPARCSIGGSTFSKATSPSSPPTRKRPTMRPKPCDRPAHHRDPIWPRSSTNNLSNECPANKVIDDKMPSSLLFGTAQEGDGRILQATSR